MSGDCHTWASRSTCYTVVSTKARTRKGCCCPQDVLLCWNQAGGMEWEGRKGGERKGREEGRQGGRARKRKLSIDGDVIHRNRESIKNIIQLIKDFSNLAKCKLCRTAAGTWITVNYVVAKSLVYSSNRAVMTHLNEQFTWENYLKFSS